MNKFIVFFCVLFLFSCKKKAPKEIITDIQEREIFETSKAISLSDTTQVAISQLIINDSFSRKKITQQVIQFYKKNDYKTRWLYDNRPAKLFYSYLQALESVELYGLNSNTYQKNELTNTVEKLYKNPEKTEIERLDRNITASFLLLTHHLINGRIPKVGNEKHIWKRTFLKQDNVEILLKLTDDENLVEVIDAMQPQILLYQQLALKYKELQNKEIDSIEKFSIPNVKNFQIGYKDISILTLRKNLKIRGFDTEPVIAPDVVDSLLIMKVIDFQKNNALAPDGIPSKRTLRILNMTNEEKRKLLILNMERIRWLYRELGENYIIVNIPEFKLKFFNKDSLRFQTNVVVGTNETPTPIFTDTLKYVEFRPTWSVPQSIVRKEMIPQIVKENNPMKYAKRGYKLYENDKEIDPNSVDWTDNENLRKRVFYFVESPSEKNSLGLVKFILTNDMSIYLHDTPSKKLFDREERAFSHGCIRVENPDEFALQLLEKQGDWNYEKVFEAMNVGKNQNRIRLKTKYIVDIIYLTTWVDEKNNLIIGNDVYLFDNEQLKQLESFF
ncbi:MAG: L,D-transpeptidase family protein [Capnocytophaga sp.]|nr:L,D-transpeptidase family protein [Capnocytophaga sp.]